MTRGILITMVVMGVIVATFQWTRRRADHGLNRQEVDRPPAISEQPQLETASLVRDMTGQQPVDGFLSASFDLQNVGNRELLISDVLASCTCANVQLSSHRILSGDGASLTVRISAAKSEVGTASIQLRTNDPRMRTPVFRVVWDPAAFGFSFEPRQLEFGRQLAGSTVSSVVRVRGTLVEQFRGDLQPVQYEPDCGVVTAVFDSFNQAVRITLSTGSQTGYHRNAIVAVSEHGEALATCPLSWEVVPEVVAIPAAVFLGTAGAGEELHERVRFVQFDGLIPSIHSAELVSDADCTIAITGTAEIRVSAVVPEEPGPWRSMVKVNCRWFDREYALELPVFLVSRNQP